MPLKSAIAEVINERDLTQEQASQAMDAIMEGDATPAQIGSYLTALRMKGETVDEIAGSAESMRRHVVAVPVSTAVTGGVLLDTCGTGGDGKQSFNISTTAAHDHHDNDREDHVDGPGGKPRSNARSSCRVCW